MHPYLTSELIHLRQQDLLREAERQQVAGALPVEPGWLRKHAGAGLIHLGRLLAGGPSGPARQARTA